MHSLDADDEECRLVDGQAEGLHAELPVGVAGVVEVRVEVEVGAENMTVEKKDSIKSGPDQHLMQKQSWFRVNLGSQ